MKAYSFKILEEKIIINIGGRICETEEELLSSKLFKEIIKRALGELKRKDSTLLDIFPEKDINEKNISTLIDTLKFLTKMPAKFAPSIVKGSESLLRDRELLNEFVEYLYNYWRQFDRFIICTSQFDELDKRPYRTFNDTIEKLTHLVRKIYRDIQENITEKHPRVYRQVRAGAEIAAIATKKEVLFPDKIYKKLNDILLIRQVLLYPPLVLNPPMNKRTGRFEKISVNPLDLVEINRDEWLCYPAKVGRLLILIYFHHRFFELGFSLCNLFELADDDTLKQEPDALYLFGVPPECLDNLGVFPTVFYDDAKNNILVAAVPNKKDFGYFGYLKKMILTLHNIRMIKEEKLPFHGAFVKINIKDNRGGTRSATVLLIGDTGAGKSETLEALRVLGEEFISEMVIIADDMGSLSIDDSGNIIGFGTEIGAFLRLDDLQPGYAYGQMDRAIIMNPHLTNARIVLPVTTYQNVIKGHKVDYILYANNYEEVDQSHPIIERFSTPQQALSVFEKGMVMSKGTTTSTGLVQSYFANIFGPPQYREEHDKIAREYFNAFFEKGIFVGQMRTRLGISGYEMKGPIEAAKRLLEIIRTQPA